MDKPFIDNFTVHSYDTDMNAVLGIQNIVKYFMETAIDHSYAVGYGIERMAAEKRGWIVLNWIIKVYEFPVYKDDINITTWAKTGNTLQATRFFEMNDEKGKIISEAASRWAFLDLEKRHPVRFSQEMSEAYCCEKESPFDPGNFIMPRECEEVLYSEKTFLVRRSETDTNGHANNIRYIEWATDEVPDSIYLNYKAEEIRVMYRKECRYGDNVTVKTYIIDDNEKKNTVTVIEDDMGKTLCKISVIWSERV